MDSDTLMQAYRETPSDALRDQLLTAHLGLVHHVAGKIGRKLTADVEHDELVSAGTMGLIKALEGFDPSRGLAFSTFAAPRIRGAILDELRRQDRVPRSVRRKGRDIAQARETLTRLIGRAPSEQELAERLGIDLPTLWKWSTDVESGTHVSLDLPLPGGEGKRPPQAELLVEDPEQGIEEGINQREEVEVVREAILRLNERERLVLSLYYFEELKLHQIADFLEITESRVSQIRSKALSKLRAEMGSRLEAVA